jgi:hypothetical protein
MDTVNRPGAPDNTIARYLAAARPFVSQIMGRGGSLSGGPVGLAANVGMSAYDARDSNFPGVAQARRRFGNPIAQAAHGFGMFPSDRVAQGFGTIAEQQPAEDPQLAQRFLQMIQSRNGAPAAPSGAPALPPATEVPPQQVSDVGRGGGGIPMPRPAPSQMEQAPSAEPAEDPGMLQRFFQGIYDNYGRGSGPAPTGPRFGPFPS